VLFIFYQNLVKNKMFNFNKQAISCDFISNPNNGLDGKVTIMYYSNIRKVYVGNVENETHALMITREFEQTFNFIKTILSSVSRFVYLFNQRANLDKEIQIKLEDFFDNSWRKSHYYSSSSGIVFLSPYLFTEQFIQSKQGKKFKDKKPSVELFVRALQSQKTILENLTVSQ
jgi:hypothetical protein